MKITIFDTPSVLHWQILLQINTVCYIQYGLIRLGRWPNYFVVFESSMLNVFHEEIIPFYMSNLSTALDAFWELCFVQKNPLPHRWFEWELNRKWRWVERLYFSRDEQPCHSPRAIFAPIFSRNFLLLSSKQADLQKKRTRKANNQNDNW